MPNKLKKKLKENEFYCVGARKKCALKPENICVTTWKNGTPALVGHCEKYNCKTTKIIKQNKVEPLTKKYGECKVHKSRKASKVRKSRKASKVRKSRKASKVRKSRKASKVRKSRKASKVRKSRKASKVRKSRKASKVRKSRKASKVRKVRK